MTWRTWPRPAAPVNVRVELPDGAGGWREVPVELVYDGRARVAGVLVHRWVAVTELAAPITPDAMPRVLYDELPPKVSIDLAVRVVPP